MNDRQSIGKFGEKKAVEFLIKNGYTVLEKNWRHGHQEIDIIAKDAQFLVFFEVKARTCASPDDMPYGRPARAVNREKQKNILLGARAYLRQHPCDGLQPRLDVIEIYLHPSKIPGFPPSVVKLHHIRNAFGAK